MYFEQEIYIKKNGQRSGEKVQKQNTKFPFAVQTSKEQEQVTSLICFFWIFFYFYRFPSEIFLFVETNLKKTRCLETVIMESARVFHSENIE